MTLWSVKLWAGIYRKIIAFSFSPFSLSALKLRAAAPQLSPGFVRRGTTSPALRRVWVLSLPDFVSGYVCCLSALALGQQHPSKSSAHPLLHTHTHTDIKDLRVVEHSRTLACRFTHTHVYIQRSAPEKLPSNPFTSLCRGLLLSGPPLRLCWW